MKVKFTAEAKKYITVAELPHVKKIMAYMKENESDESLKDYAQMAARVASGDWNDFEILKAEAEISKNCRAHDNFHEGSGNLDIWLTIYAFNAYKGFYNIGVYLSDLWQLTGDNGEEIRSHMYIAEYVKPR